MSGLSVTPPRTDVHAHLIPPAWLEHHATSATDAGSWVVTGNEGERTLVFPDGSTWPILPALWDIEGRLRELEQQNIDRQLAMPPIPLLGGKLPRRAAQAAARLFNETVADLSRASEGRLVPSCAVPLQDPDVAATEARYAVEVLGARAVVLSANSESVDLAGEHLLPFFRAVSELGVVVVVHPDEREGWPSLRQKFLQNLVGNPLASTIAVARLVAGGLLDRLPELRLCVVHGGGALPFILGRMRHGSTTVPQAALPKPIDAYFEQIYVDTLVHDDNALRYLFETLGEQQIVVGTDDPYLMGDHDPYSRLERAGLGHHEAVLAENAARILGPP